MFESSLISILNVFHRVAGTGVVVFLCLNLLWLFICDLLT